MNDGIIDIVYNLVATIIVALAVRLFLYIKKIGIGLNSYLLFILTFLLFLLPISTFVTLFVSNKVSFLFLINIVLLISSFIVGFVAFKRFKEEHDLYIFIKSAKKEITDRYMYDCICSIRRAFHEIEMECNKNFKRGQCIDRRMKVDSFFSGQLPDKVTTQLELNLFDIYKKHINQTKYNKNIYTDIHEDPVEPDQNIKYRWILDILDGGLHFLRNIPLFTSSVALQSEESPGNWKTILGAIYIPLTKEIFFTLKGKGAYLNNWDCRLPLERKEKMKNSIFYIEFPGKTANENKKKVKYDEACMFLNKIFPKVSKVRGFNLGSFGLAYLAKGSFDAYISLSGRTSFYDSEAGKLLVEESEIIGKSGSKGKFIKEEIITSRHGFDCSRIFASSGQIYNELKNDAELQPILKELFSGF